MAGIAIVLDLLKKSHNNTHRIHHHSSSSLSPASVVASAAAVSAAASAPFASRFLFGSFEPRVAYCDASAAAVAGIDDDYLAAIRKVSAEALQLQPSTYIPTSKVYNIQPKPLFSAFEFRALAMTTVRSLLMFYLPLLEPKPASEEDDDDDFLDNAPEEGRRRVDLIVPLKKSAQQIARETTVVTTRRVLERLAVSYVSQRMAWKLLKDVPQSTLRKAGRGWPTHVYIYKVSQTTLRGHFLGIAASWTVQVGIEIYRCVFKYVKPLEEEEEEGEQVVISERAKDLGNKVVGITVRCGASLVFAAIGAGICSCLIRPSLGQWIGCALGDLAGPMVVSICLQKTLQADS
ncbi:Isopentenyl-diphosphate delta-isomerase [Hirschfeldia incana]|nr:Isopentenyl-diphosphate delta-isomerase [Hirschfeldia incana]